jgi:hypothetical protein
VEREVVHGREVLRRIKRADIAIEPIRRPQLPTPDLTGAVQHAMAALECVARTATRDPNPTLGTLLKKHPGLVPTPLDVALEKVWVYALNIGRHLKEGHPPTREKAELVVGVATVVATYSLPKNGEGRVVTNES